MQELGANLLKVPFPSTWHSVVVPRMAARCQVPSDQKGRNVMARRPEESARAILRILVPGGTKADEIVLYGNLERAFLDSDPDSLAPEFVEGLKYAEGQGWLTIIEGTQIKLTNHGYEAA
jgi:hypothetical protein